MCDQVSRRYTWGFALMVKNGWQASDGDGSPRWRCSRCAREAAGSSADDDDGRLCVLVVDSADSLLGATRRILPDFEVISTLNAREALRILDSIWFDAIVCEVVLPDLSGPEFYELACTRWPHLATRFVFVTTNAGHAESELAAVARRVGHEMPPLLDRRGASSGLSEAVSLIAERGAALPGVRAVRGAPPPTKAFG